MLIEPREIGPESRVTGHLQVRLRRGERIWVAQITDRDSVKRTRVLGPAHVKDSGKRTPRGAVIWRTGNGPCPDGYLTPTEAEDKLAELIQEFRTAPRAPAAKDAAPGESVLPRATLFDY